MTLGSTQLLTEMSTRCISWGKGGRCVRLTNLQPSCAVVMKSGNLNFLQPSGPLQTCNGTALTFINILNLLQYTVHKDFHHYVLCVISYIMTKVSEKPGACVLSVQDVLCNGSVEQLLPCGIYGTLVLTAITNCVRHKTHVQIMNTMHDTGQQTDSDIWPDDRDI